MHRSTVIINSIGIIAGLLTVASPSSAEQPEDVRPPGGPTIPVSVSTPGNTSPPNANNGGGGDDAGPSNGGSSNSSRSACGDYQHEGVFFDRTTGEVVAEGGPGTEEAVSVMCSSASDCPPGFSSASPAGASGAALCMGVVPFGEEPAPPTVDDLMPGAYDEAVAQIPLPDPSAISPGVEQGSLVNFGMWLAVPETAAVTARAEVGAVWAQATGTLVSTSFDMGNGDVVECVGTGEILTAESPAWDTTEPSPSCGYTYEWPSAPQFTGTDDLAYHLTVTTHWEVRGTGSDGRDVAMDPVDVSFEFTYQVREVQTVGTP